MLKEKERNGFAKMIEFNIELKLTKLVRGQGLAKLLAEENSRSLDMDFFCGRNWSNRRA